MRFGAAIVLTGLLLTSNVVAPRSLKAAAATAALSVNDVLVCEYVNDAIAFIQQRPESRLRRFLLDLLGKIKTRYEC